MLTEAKLIAEHEIYKVSLLQDEAALCSAIEMLHTHPTCPVCAKWAFVVCVYLSVFFFLSSTQSEPLWCVCVLVCLLLPLICTKWAFVVCVCVLVCLLLHLICTKLAFVVCVYLSVCFFISSAQSEPLWCVCVYLFVFFVSSAQSAPVWYVYLSVFFFISSAQSEPLWCVCTCLSSSSSHLHKVSLCDVCVLAFVVRVYLFVFFISSAQCEPLWCVYFSVFFFIPHLQKWAIVVCVLAFVVCVLVCLLLHPICTKWAIVVCVLVCLFHPVCTKWAFVMCIHVRLLLRPICTAAKKRLCWPSGEIDMPWWYIVPYSTIPKYSVSLARAGYNYGHVGFKGDSTSLCYVQLTVFLPRCILAEWSVSLLAPMHLSWVVCFTACPKAS